MFLILGGGTSPVLASGDPTTLCAPGFNGADIAFRTVGPPPFLAFIASPSAPVVNRYPATPGGGSCTFGPAFAIPVGVSSAWGVALGPGPLGNLFVSAGPGVFNINQVLRISSPAGVPGAPVVFFSPAGFFNLRSLATIGTVLYAADFGNGKIYRFDLSMVPCMAGPFPVPTTAACFSILAAVPGVFGLVPNPSGALDDLYATSNAGFNGITSGVGTDDIKHVTTSGVTPLPASTTSFPEGIGGSLPTPICTSVVVGCLYVAAGGVVHEYDLSSSTYTTTFASPPFASHGVTFWTGGLYVTDSITFSIYKIT